MGYFMLHSNYYYYLSSPSSYLLMAVCLCTKVMRSAALPDPSSTNTGTGGTLLTYSSTVDTIVGPPSTTTQTTGTPWFSPTKMGAKSNPWAFYVDCINTHTHVSQAIFVET